MVYSSKNLVFYTLFSNSRGTPSPNSPCKTPNSSWNPRFRKTYTKPTSIRRFPTSTRRLRKTQIRWQFFSPRSTLDAEISIGWRKSKNQKLGNRRNEKDWVILKCLKRKLLWSWEDEKDDIEKSYECGAKRLKEYKNLFMEWLLRKQLLPPLIYVGKQRFREREREREVFWMRLQTEAALEDREAEELTKASNDKTDPPPVQELHSFF